MSTFNEQLFEKKLLALKDTQDSISNLSSWCLSQPQHHKKIVQIWLQVLKKVKIEQRLSLFYLANDVIQYSKRKGYEFVKSWGTALQRATTMVRGHDKIRTKVMRLINIWDDRNIYDEAFLIDLVGLLSSRTPAQAAVSDAQDFQPSTLITKLSTCKTLEDDTDARMKIVNESDLCLNDVDTLRCSLKDRRHGEDVVAEVEEGIGKMEAYIRALEVEIKERHELLELLDMADVFYETQKGEAKIVCNAYRNFGMRVKSLKKKLEELIPTLPSPIPSPDINAPSPSPELDIDLPDHGFDNLGMSSFVGSLVIPESGTIQFVTDTSPQPVQPPNVFHNPPLTPQTLNHYGQEDTAINPGSSHINQEEFIDFPISFPDLNKPPPPPPPLPVSQPFPAQSPLSNYSRSSVPPLLGDGQDFNVNGNDSFLSTQTLSENHQAPSLGTGLSFIGNPDFQFHFENFKQNDVHYENRIKSDSSKDLPYSPKRFTIEDCSLSSSELTSHNASKEGKPIEVISSSKIGGDFVLADFLKTLVSPQQNNQNLILPATDLNLESPASPVLDAAPLVNTSIPPPNVVEENFADKLWDTAALPSKYHSWGDSEASWGEGISSPPMYEEGFGNPLDCDVPTDINCDDIDPDLRPAVDVDHRNLISLTGSPSNNNDNSRWLPQTDVDYRKMAGTDNRDIVDMEMSDEDEPQNPFSPTRNIKTIHPQFQKNQHNRKFHRQDHRGQLETLTGGPNQSISFNLPTAANKLLLESPLNEKEEEPKKKLPLLRGSPLGRAEMKSPPMLPSMLFEQVDLKVENQKSEEIQPEHSDQNRRPSLENIVEENFAEDKFEFPSQNEDTDSRFFCPLQSNQKLQNFNQMDENNSGQSVITDINVLTENDQDNKNNQNNLQFPKPPLLNTPPPPPPTNNPSQFGGLPGPPMFQTRPPLQRPGANIWWGPRRGMSPRFRHPLGMSPHMRSPLQQPPRSPFRGNNKWRPQRFQNWTNN